MAKRRRTDPRKLPKQPRAMATLDALLVATAHILVRDGYEKANVNAIAKHAGCSIGSLYQYFPSKDALVAAVIQRHAERMIDCFLKSIVELANLPVRDAIRGVLERTFDAISIDPELHKVILEQVPRTGILKRHREFSREFEAILRAYFTFHKDELAIRNLDLQAQILVDSVEAVVQAMVLRDPKLPQRKELVDELTALVVGYVGKPSLL